MQAFSCEHMFGTVLSMTAQGSPISVLRRAIKGGSLGAVEMALIDVPQLDLQDALEVVLLMAKADDPRFDRWANRWAERVNAAEGDQLLTLLERLPDERAVEALRERAVHLRSVQPGTRVHLS